MKKRDVKYQWALYENKLIHISEVTKEMRSLQKFRSQVTNEPMTAYLEGKFQRHFHHINQKSVYNKETYLHETGKHLFYRKYQESLKNELPFYLEYQLEYQCNKHFKSTKINCDTIRGYKKFDLTTKYKEISLETYHEGLKPDLTLISEDNDEVIYVEIAVTHESTQKKKLSGNRIIEIKLEKESDLDLLSGNEISMKSTKVRFYNFKSRIINVEYCPTKYGYCQTYGAALKIKKDGSFEFISDTLENLSELKLKDKISNFFIYEEKFNSYVKNDRFEYMKLKEASEKGIKIRDCRICQNSITDGKDWKYDRLYCRSYKMKLRSNLADNCEKLRY